MPRSAAFNHSEFYVKLSEQFGCDVAEVPIGYSSSPLMRITRRGDNGDLLEAFVRGREQDQVEATVIRSVCNHLHIPESAFAFALTP